MGEKEKMISGEEYLPFCFELEKDRIRAKTLCMEYNALTLDKKDENFFN